MMPLSQVLAYNTEHLIDAAAHWQGLADQREEVFATVRNEAYALPWEGQAAEATHQRTQADHNTAMGSADNLRQAAMIAKDGASTLTQMHSRVLYTLEDAQADGFVPSEDLSMVDTRPSANPAELAQRQAQAQAYAGQLKAQVAALETHDAEVGTGMTNATAGEGSIRFADGKPINGHVMAVDNHSGDGGYDPNQGGGNFERKFWNDVITDAIAGGAVGSMFDGVGAIPGAAAGGAWAAIKDGLHFIAGDGHDY